MAGVGVTGGLLHDLGAPSAPRLGSVLLAYWVLSRVCRGPHMDGMLCSPCLVGVYE